MQRIMQREGTADNKYMRHIQVYSYGSHGNPLKYTSKSHDCPFDPQEEIGGQPRCIVVLNNEHQAYGLFERTPKI